MVRGSEVSLPEMRQCRVFNRYTHVKNKQEKKKTSVFKRTTVANASD